MHRGARRAESDQAARFIHLPKRLAPRGRHARQFDVIVRRCRHTLWFEAPHAAEILPRTSFVPPPAPRPGQKPVRSPISAKSMMHHAPAGGIDRTIRILIALAATLMPAAG